MPNLPWSLHRHVSAILAESDEVQPEKLARLAADSIPDAHVRAALAQALESYVRVLGGRKRATNPLVGWNQSPQPTASVRVAAIREAWLRDRVHVGDGTWKALGDCNYGDLMFAAEERRRMARLTIEAAERYERLAGKLRTLGVSTVADLRPEDLWP